MATQVNLAANMEQNISRPLANFPPSPWGCSFASVSLPEEEFESYTREVEVLKEKVKDMLVASTRDLVKNIQLINLLCRLGVSYHFESEIKEQLNHISNVLSELSDDNDYDLHTVALFFRVLREHRYNMSCDVFNKFKGGDGKFKDTLANDVRGILSLYEATFLSMHGEDILDEALAFARSHLELVVQSINLDDHLAKHIKDALSLPFHKALPRAEARKYISFYQEEESRNETLLKFAKVDFNRVQLLHKQEIGILTRWWKDSNLAGELPYARDRIVEAYFLGLATHFEPQYVLSHILVGKYIQMIALLDDTYDAYGTLEELRCFTNVFERCSIDAIDELPVHYLKVLLKALLNYFQELETHASEGGKSYVFHYLMDAFKELAKSYLIQQEWLNDGYVPSFNEYMRYGLISSTYSSFSATAFIGMEKFEGFNECEWLQSNSKIVKGAQLLGRLKNDIRSNEDEQKRGHPPSGVECYMKEYGVSREEAIEGIQKICADAWKDINEELIMNSTSVPMPIATTLINNGRLAEELYQQNDAFTNPASLKEYIDSLFLEKVPE